LASIILVFFAGVVKFHQGKADIFAENVRSDFLFYLTHGF